MNLDAKERMLDAVLAVEAAVRMLESSEPTMRAFMDETRLMASAGPVLAPALFLSAERRAVEAVVVPCFAAALAFVDVYRTHKSAAAGALSKVTGG